MDTANSSIVLTVNGRRETVAARTIADLVTVRGLADMRVATALNGRFVPAAARATTVLSEGDRVEIVSARQGG